MPFIKSREVFTSGLAFTYFCAFASAFSQHMGLFGEHQGLAPISSTEALNAQVIALGWSVDEVFFLVYMSAMLLSIMLTFRLAVSQNFMILLPIAYWWLVKTYRLSEAPFYNFQWDALLIETGVIGYFWILQTGEESECPPRSANWAIRFLAFKLMFSSGVVKITASDPTWLSLRALQYHFASQPLPTPLAWYAHQLPSWFLIVGTASSMWIEIPLAIFLLSPFPTMRIIAAVAQIVLMVSISLTGNYNFFNLLTSVLMIPLINEGDFRLWRKSRLQKWFDFVGSVCCIILLGWMTVRMFEFNLDKVTPIKLALTVSTLNQLMNEYLPYLIGFSFAGSIIGTIQDIWESWFDEEARILHIRLAVGCVSAFLIVICAVPMGFSLMTDRSRLESVAPQKVVRLYVDHCREFSSSYGLFRTMTGVGRDGKVRVPVVLFDLDSTRLEFQAYPSSELSVPAFVQPYQPRLDWQLWFASLTPESYLRNEKWFRAFCEAVLARKRAVWSLLKKNESMKNLQSDSETKFKAIKVLRAEFDFSSNWTSDRWWTIVGPPKPMLAITKHADVSPPESFLETFWIDNGHRIPVTILVVASTVYLVFRST